MFTPVEKRGVDQAMSDHQHSVPKVWAIVMLAVVGTIVSVAVAILSCLNTPLSPTLVTAGHILTGTIGVTLAVCLYLAAKAWRHNENLQNNEKLPWKTIALYIIYALTVLGPGLVCGALASSNNLSSSPLLASLVLAPIALHLLERSCFKRLSVGCRIRALNYIY